MIYGYRDISVQKIKVIKSHVNVYVYYLLPTFPDNYIFGWRKKYLSYDA